MYILLPPSEGKLSGAARPTRKRLPAAIVPEILPLLEHLENLAELDRLKFYGVSTREKAAEIHEINLSVLSAPAIPAIERYTGVVYGNLDFHSLHDQAGAANRILIVSGMFGLIRGCTPIPEYKLPLNPWLTQYWKPINERRFRRMIKKEAVISLLPQAHGRALPSSTVTHVDFKLQDGRSSAGHFGKAIKGKFVRWLLQNEVDDPGQFVEFTLDGYRFNGKDFVQG
ncbi:MAG: peroxide stress protein YaaA [Candidatus Hydrogenedentes bacterium]|nr:peroxide stress protein YaaA [Candidatus Hydrogenedentota bacterium]